MLTPRQTISLLVAAHFAAPVYWFSSSAWPCAPVEDESADTRSPSEDEKAEAARLFREGTRLENEGNVAGALEKYLASHHLAPRKSNTKNAARCLDILGRSDEALAMYEKLLQRFRKELNETEYAAIRKDMVDLRSAVAILQFEGGQGELFVDGEPCGKLPRADVLYVLPGNRKLRIDRTPNTPWIRLLPLTKDTVTRITVDAPEANKQGNERPRKVEPDKPKSIDDSNRLHWVVDFAGGIALGGGLNSAPELAAEKTCTTQCPSAFGGAFQLRAGQEIRKNFYLGVAFGQLELSSTFLRTEVRKFFANEPSSDDVTYLLSETLQLRGPWLGLSFDYRYRIKPFTLSASLVTALFSADSVEHFDLDPAQSKAMTVGNSPDQIVVTGNEQVRSVAPILVPRLDFVYHVSGFYVGLSLGMTLVLTEGSRLNTRTFGTAKNCSGPTDNSAGCAAWPDTPLNPPPRQPINEGDSTPNASFGRNFFIHPQLVLGYGL